jgi:hypothetical protein
LKLRMAGELQHCPTCREEYVAGIAACVECGEPLHPGPLPRGAAATAPAARAAAAANPAGELDRLIAELPGRQADHVVRSLLLEGIACRVECQGVVKVYQAEQRPSEPFAVTLPVTIHVAAAQLENAQEVLESLQQEDVIGEQWSEVPPEDEASGDHDDEYEQAEAGDGERLAAGTATEAEPDDAAAPAPPAAESTTLRTIVLIVAVGLVLLLIFAR